MSGHPGVDPLIYNKPMPLKQKVVVAGFALLGVIIIVAALFVPSRAKQAGVPKTATPTPMPVRVEPPPRTIEFPQIPTGASFVYSGKPKAVPTSMPVYRYSETQSPSALNKLADTQSSNFGIHGTPSATVEGQSFMYTRNDEYRSFSLSKTKNVVSVTYQRALVEDATMFLKESSQNAAVSFFTSLLSLPGVASYYSLPGGDRYFEGVVVLERPVPELTDYPFGISIQNVPALTREYTKRWASIIVDDKKAVRVLNYIPFPSVTFLTQTTIIRPEGAIQNINDGRGNLLWITQTTGEQYGVTPSFQKGVLTDFSLVYVYQENSLIPAYLFTGSGLTPAGTQQVFEVLVLAVPSQR